MTPIPLNQFRARFYRSWLALVSQPMTHAWYNWIAFVGLCVVITLVMTLSFSQMPRHVVAGQISPYDIRADRNYIILDKESVAEVRQAAAEQVLNVYDFDLESSNLIAERVHNAFTVARKKLQEKAPSEEFRAAWEQACGLGLSDAQWEYLSHSNFNKAVEDSILSAVIGIMRHPIVNDKSALLLEKDRGVTVQQFGLSSDHKARLTTWSAKEIPQVWSLEDAKKQIKAYKDVTRNEALASIVSQLIQTNFVRNTTEIDVARRAAMDAVKDVTITLQAGEVIVRAGARYEPRHVAIIDGVNQQSSRGSLWGKCLGYFILVTLVLWVSYEFGSRYVRKFRLNSRDTRFVGFLLVAVLLFIRFSFFVAYAVSNSPFLPIPAQAYTYIIPVAVGAMLVRLILNAEVALIFAVVVSILTGFFILNDPYFTAYALISNIVAASAITNVDKRSSVVRAGMTTGCFNVLAVIALLLAQSYQSTAVDLSWVDVLWCLFAALVGGLLNAFVLLIGAPIIEFMFGYSTDMKLLELANLNHPLLRELIIRAPGTYHHSHLVGILSEAAAEKIGANPLLARVGAYYHDIGKMRKPQYFIENAKENTSWHERISPHMAALIISSHIKDGVEMARQAGLPEQIVDLIPQHHGTKMIGFFYELAKKSNDPELQTISEADFRYPGPKPQSQEAGILLLADGVEASVRALKEKSPTRIQQTVESIINKSFVESQLDECDLTLKDLNDIATSFTHILVGIYHQRIEYPKQSTDLGQKGKAIG